MSSFNSVAYTYIDHGKGRGVHSVVFEFSDEQEAKEFARLAQISKDVDDELLLYGDGVLRTISGKRKINVRAAKQRRNTRSKSV